MNEELEEDQELEEEIQEPEQEEEELDELAPEDIAPVPVLEGGRFYIQTEDHLDWYVKKFLQKENHLKNVKAMAKVKMAEAAKDLENFKKRHEPDARLVSTSLLPKGKKTVKLWSGAVSFTSVGATIKILDPQKIPEKYKEIQLVKQTVINTDSLKTDILSNGEVIDGVESVQAYQSMKVKEPKK